VHPFQLSLIVAQERAADARRRADKARQANCLAGTGVNVRQRSRVIESLLRVRTAAQS
jgi:hypothetical protein